MVSMTRIYIAPFHSRSLDLEKTAVILGRDTWPYDYGDDPSFYTMRRLGGRLSWGVCRPDVRNAIQEGDITVFFSYAKCKDGKSEYRFCCIATVDCKISQADIWQKERFFEFQKYCNLLVRPSKPDGVWEHFEPCLQGSRAHKHWLWRCAEHSHLKKEEFQKIVEMNSFKPGIQKNGKQINFAHNYVIFSLDPTKTYVLSNPPIIANHVKGQHHEEWNEDNFSQLIWSYTLEKAMHTNDKERWLRTKNIQQPHRHIVFELPDENANNWRANILQLVEGR